MLWVNDGCGLVREVIRPMALKQNVADKVPGGGADAGETHWLP